MKKIVYIKAKERMLMNRNNIRNGVIVGSVVGLSVGMLVANTTKNNPRKKIMKTAKKAKSTLVNGINSLLG
jgi:gas vesicle protein